MPGTPSMIERVAQAIRISLHLATDREREAANRAAIAVLAAMREPTEAMLVDGSEVMLGDVQISLLAGDIRIMWQAMIDTALEDAR